MLLHVHVLTGDPEIPVKPAARVIAPKTEKPTATQSRMETALGSLSSSPCAGSRLFSWSSCWWPQSWSSFRLSFSFRFESTVWSSSFPACQRKRPANRARRRAQCMR